MKISVITPSYNQGEYIDETIESVVGQNYEDKEYLILDGGSNDNSVELIKKHKEQIDYFRSGRDNGQASAINEGITNSKGDIICWLNSDDYFLPGTLSYVAKNLNPNNAEMLIGNSVHIWENSSKVMGSDVCSDNCIFEIEKHDFIIQPSCFFTRKALEKCGLPDESYTYVFDWDYWIRMRKAGVKIISTNRYLSVYRIHQNHKSSSGDTKRIKEVAAIYRKNLGNKYKKFFLWAVKKKRQITNIYNLFGAIRMRKLEDYFLKIVYWKELEDIPVKDITQILKMVL